MTMTQPWAEETVEVEGINLQIIKGGSGEPLLILHDEMGHPGWLRYHEALSENFELTIPFHPGFGESGELDWVMGMRDLSGWYLGCLDRLGLEDVNVIGFGLGGWLAAEMATMCPQQFKKLVLVDAVGVKPTEGEIYDIFQVVAKDFIRDSILNPEETSEFQMICPDEPTPDQSENWERARETSCRLGWRPYMHNPALPKVLFRLSRLPTLIIWGEQDSVVPVSAGQVYHQGIPGSKLAIIKNSGHRPEVEQADEFIGLVRGFLQG